MNRRFAVAMATGLLLTTAGGFAQQTPPTTPPTNGTATPGNFPGRGGMPQNTGPKPYGEVITSKAKTDRGLFVTHKVEEKYYFEIPDSLLGREILVVNRIAKAPAGPRAGFIGYAGDIIGKNEISFEKGPNNKVFMRGLSFAEAGRDSAGMYNAVRNSNLSPIVAAFDIRAFAKDSITGNKGTVIEVTEYLMGDNDILFFAPGIKRTLGLAGYQRETSYINEVTSFPTNIEIKTVKTYMRTPTPAGGGLTISFGPPAAGSPSTFELNSSMIMLPKVPMRPRYFDPRVGYFAAGFTDYDANPQGVERIQMAVRWRLEPKPEDVEKYKRGELVEPAKPIVYYIDPATPKKWVPYLKQGVDDWQTAFEKAGFKNAIMAKMAPANDSTWRLEDARHSAIVYKPSDIPNASGPNVHDPRSGEILESHINWYHNVMSLVRDWYFVQTAAVDPRARQLVFPDSLMGQLIRFVSSHEVGHTLGLRHNYGSSSTVPVENLRNKSWVETNGHTPSIMDYARFNYVAQPEDNVNEKGLFPRIGDYDIWAIEWGYRWMPEYSTADQEKTALNKLTSEKLKNKRLWFGTEIDPDDPRGQNEDLGDNAMKASAYGIKNLQRIIVNLPEWTKESNKDYASLTQMYSQLTAQYQRYMGHVAKNIGGIQTTPRMREEGGVVMEFTPKAKQKEAINFLHTQLFNTPIWLKQQKIESLINVNPMTTILGVQNSILGRLLSNNTFNKLFRYEATGATNAYTASEMVTDLRKGIWRELASRKPIDIYRRNLQKAFVEQLAGNLKPDGSPMMTVSSGRGGFNLPSDYSRTTDAISIVKAQLRQLQNEIRAAIPAYNDAASRAHLQDVNERITQVLDPR